MQNGPATTEKVVGSFDTNNHTYILDTINGKGFFDNNTIVDLPGNTNKTNCNYYLFSESIIDQSDTHNIRNFARFKMNYCSIKDENKKYIRNYIPCYATTIVSDVNNKECSEGTIGMYDLVEGKFYTNQGKGEFLKGEDV